MLPRTETMLGDMNGQEWVGMKMRKNDGGIRTPKNECNNTKFAMVRHWEGDM